MDRQPRRKIDLRVPGIFKFQVLLSLVLSVWLFYPWPESDAEFINNVQGVVALWGLTALVFALFLSYRVTYTVEGLYIRPGGWKALLGLQKEHFVAFNDIRKMTPGFDRGGQGRMDWLSFGHLQLHTRTGRDDEGELVLRQVFLDRQELLKLLYSLKNERPEIIDDETLETLASA